MKKVLSFLVVFFCIISLGGISFANNDNYQRRNFLDASELDTLSTLVQEKGNLVSSQMHFKGNSGFGEDFSLEVSNELSKEEINRIAIENDLGDISHLLFTESELQEKHSRSQVVTSSHLEGAMANAAGDLDLVQYHHGVLVDSSTEFTIWMGIQNLDTEIHDLYTGTANGYRAVAPGSSTMIWLVNHDYRVTQVGPGHLPADAVSILFMPGSKAYFYIWMQAFDDGVPMSPFYRGYYNRYY